MSRLNILVTGVGAIIGYGIVNSLKTAFDDINIIGIDIYHDAVGRHWCDHFEKGVFASSLDYPDFINDLVKRYDLNLIIPGIEQDVDALSKMVQDKVIKPSLIALNSNSALDIFGCKVKTSDLQKFLGLPYIHYSDATKTYQVDEVIEACGLPCIYKPNKSYAGKGIKVIHNAIELENVLKGADGIFQRYISSGIEYTISVFGIGDGDYVNPIAFDRKLGPDGATHKAKVVDFEEFRVAVTTLCMATKPAGPTNFQFILDDKSDQILLLEVNPRTSASTSIREKFGVNEAKMCIEFYVHNVTPESQTVRYGTAERFIDEVVNYDSDNI